MADNGGAPQLLDPKYAPGAEQARQDVMVGVSIMMTLIGLACVGLRVYTRAFIVRNMGSEDWTMISVAVLTLVFLLELVAGAKEFKFGFGGMSLTPVQMEGGIKLGLAIIVIYKTIMTLIKISILLIYLRLAVNKTFELLCKGTICLLATWQFIVVVVVTTQCTPLHKLWDLTGQVQGRCINANAFYNTTSIFHIVVDFWILLLPVKFIISIPRPPRERLALYLVFGLGIFSTVASIVRLQYLLIFERSQDPFYDSLPANTWSMVEVNIGILCASLPTLRPLFSKAQRHRTREALNISGKQGGSSKKGLLTTGKDMFISINLSVVKSPKAATFKRGFDVDSKPPPVPPKDAKFESRPSTANSSRIAYPEMAFRKV